jgi:ubiquinone/menaquinone biosynthesis C-methylase UbiE
VEHVEPSRLEVLIEILAGKLLPGPYREYVDRLDLRGDERVLDFGSGVGTPARFLAERLLPGGGKVTCVDVSRRFMDAARQRLKKYPNVEFKLGALPSLGLPAHSYDAVLIHFVLHEIPPSQRRETIHRLSEALVPDGRVFIREPLAERQNPISPEEIRSLLREHGLAETFWQLKRVPLAGPTYEGVYVLHDAAA